MVFGEILTSIITGFKSVIDFLMSMFQAFYENSPKIFKIFLFLFLTLFVANAVIGTILNLNFACNSDNTLLRPRGFFDAVRIYYENTFTDIENNTALYNNFLQNRTTPTAQYDRNSPESIVAVKCINQNPRWTPFGFIDILDFRLWVIIMFISLLAWFYKEWT